MSITVGVSTPGQDSSEAWALVPRTWWGFQREFFIDNLLVRILFVFEMIWWTGLAPWEF